MRSYRYGRLVVLVLVTVVVAGCVPTGVRQAYSNDVCTEGVSGWAYRLNDYVVSKQRVVPRPQRTTKARACASPFYRDRLIESERALSMKEQGYPHMRVMGDVCGNNATLILQDEAFLTPEQVRLRLQHFGNRDRTLWQFAPHGFYVPWQGDTRQHGALNAVERSLVKYKAILAAQCKTIPARVRVVGRGGYTPVRRDFRGRMDKDIGYAWKEFYSGWLDPRSAGVELRHDDAELAARYQQYAVQRSASIDRARLLRQQRQEEGGALFVLLLYGLHVSSPCNNPDLPAHRKPYWCD